MAVFPDSDVELTSQVALGADLTADPLTWTWTDLSSRVVADQTVSVTRGTAVGAGTAQTSKSSILLTNADGYLTPKNPASPYWPYIDSGTPFRIRLRTVTTPLFQDLFTRSVSGGWGTSTSGDAWTVSGSTSQWGVNGTQGTVALNVVNSFFQATAGTPYRDVDEVFDLSVSAVAAGAPIVAGRLYRWTAATATGLYVNLQFSAAGTVAVVVYAYVNGVAQTDALVFPGLSYSAGTVVRTRVQVQGNRLRVRAWLAAGSEPVTTWHVNLANNAYPDAGTVARFATYLAAGNSNTLPLTVNLDNLTTSQPYYDRIEGFIGDVQPTFQPLTDGTTWSTVRVDIGGIGSRLERRTAAEWSPMRRSVQLSDPPPVAYWPLEDEENSTQGASAFAGQPAMLVNGPAVFAFAKSLPTEQWLARYGSKAIVSVAAGARLHAIVPASSVTSQWAVSCVAELFVPEVPGVTEIRILEWATPGGTWTRWALVETTTGYEVRAYNDVASSTATVLTDTAGPYNLQVTYTVEAAQSGGNINVQVFYNSLGGSTGSVAGTLAAVQKIAVNPDSVNTTAAVTPFGLKFVVGHVRVVDDTSVSDMPYYQDLEQGIFVYADRAWGYESAHQRIRRLCDEEQVPLEILGTPATTGLTQLNAQPDGTFQSLLQRTAESESGGILYEGGFGYKYLPRSERYNARVALTIDLDTVRRSEKISPDDVLVPQLESRAVNSWSVKRDTGSTGTAASSAAVLLQRGTIAGEVTVDVLKDTDLALHAQWRLHLTEDAADAYYPSVPLELHANPSLAADWLGCDIGSRVQRTNQPTIAGWGTIDQVIDGYTESFSPRQSGDGPTWTVDMNCSPGGVWDVVTPGDALLGWLQPTSTLATAISSSATTLVIASVGPTWSTNSSNYPVDIKLAGERITLASAPGGSTSPQTFTGCTRGVSGFSKAHSVGETVTLWYSPALAL